MRALNLQIKELLYYKGIGEWSQGKQDRLDKILSQYGKLQETAKKFNEIAHQNHVTGGDFIHEVKNQLKMKKP